MNNSIAYRRLINVIVVLVFSVITYLAYSASFILIDWLVYGLVPTNESKDGIIYGLVLFAPAPFIFFAVVAIVVMCVTHKWDVLDKTSSSIILGIILGLATAVFSVPFHVLTSMLLGVGFVPNIKFTGQ